MDTTAPALYVGTDADAYLAGIARYDAQVTDEMDAAVAAHKMDVIDVMIDRAILLLSRPVLTAA